MKRIQTVCLIWRGKEHLILGRQKDTPTKKWKKGIDYWNGFGGLKEDGESIEEAAQREVKEEACVRVPKIYKAGVMDFTFTDGDHSEVHIFGADGCEGDPVETEEMKPDLFHISQIPYDQMWPADRHWMPFFLARKLFRGRVLFGENKEILEWEVEHA